MKHYQENLQKCIVIKLNFLLHFLLFALDLTPPLAATDAAPPHLGGAPLEAPPRPRLLHRERPAGHHVLY